MHWPLCLVSEIRRGWDGTGNCLSVKAIYWFAEPQKGREGAVTAADGGWSPWRVPSCVSLPRESHQIPCYVPILQESIGGTGLTSLRPLGSLRKAGILVGIQA